MREVRLTTPRLSLIPIRAAHADGIWRAVEAALPELLPWMAWAEDASPSAQSEFAARAELAWLRDEHWTFSILHDGKISGTVGVGKHDALFASAQIGYWIRSDLAGQGLVTEAASAVVTFAFEELRLHRLELHAAHDNIGSRRVAAKLSFQEEGRLRDGARGSGGFHDAIVYGLLATDPRPAWHIPGGALS